MQERRVVPRWELHVHVTLESESNLYAGISCDVSAGGIFVATDDTPPLGEEVSVRLVMPDATELLLSGHVSWVRDHRQASPGLPAGCGIAWRTLPVEALRVLVHFAELREPLLFEL